MHSVLITTAVMVPLRPHRFVVGAVSGVMRGDHGPHLTVGASVMWGKLHLYHFDVLCPPSDGDVGQARVVGSDAAWGWGW